VYWTLQENTLCIAFEPIRSNLGQQVFEYLMSEIYSMRIAPGERLGVGDIAERLNISRSPVRDALKLLVAEGLVEHSPTHGYHVIDIDVTYISEAFGVRRALEAEALRLYGQKPVPHRVTALLATWNELKNTITDSPHYVESHMEADTALHQTLGAMCGNSLLDEYLARVIFRAGFIRQWVYKNGVSITHLVKMTEEHLTILQYMHEHDIPSAIEAMMQHLNAGEQAALDLLNGGSAADVHSQVEPM
jgi:DNA-binding GntR family transcriptional regulator